MEKRIFSGMFCMVAASLIVLNLTGCIRNENSPGYEYMPDMYRSPAIEAYVDYGELRDTINIELMNTMSARLPVEGTVPVSDNALNDIPYTIPNTLEGYELAGQVLRSPIAFTPKVIEEGKKLYLDFCSQCHGKEGKGDGPVVEKGGHPGPQAYNGPLKDLSQGKMFHSITYGKGAMGGHASQLTKKERWKIVSYVVELQKIGNVKADQDESSETSLN